MSLIPYQPLEGREIVLRHRNAMVVRDPDSQRLEIRGYAECPTCHQPLRPSSAERPFERSYETTSDSYVDPNYFRMLQARNGDFTSNGPPSSPGRRFQAALPNNRGGSSSSGGAQADAENRAADFLSVSETQEGPHAEGARIKREAFTPNYFKTFFVEERVLGRGGKGIVLLVRHEIDGCHLGHFACKRVPIGDDHAWLEKVLIEVELLANLSHPNLVSYRHVWLEDTQLTVFGPPVPCAFILQQYCNSGDLHQYVVGSAPREFTKEELKERMRRRSKGRLDEPPDASQDQPQLSFEEIYSLFKDITSGVAYLHNANYVHRDLKPSNCLLHREGAKLRCLISDFGEVQPEHIIRKSTGSTGTISYCAPEVLKMDSQGNYANFTTKSDVFSLGMILYFMCFGRLPYRSANALQEELEDIDLLRAEITDWKGFQDEKRERPDLPAKLYMLLKKLLALNPAQRPSANEVLSAMRSETIGDGMTRERSLSPAKGLRGSRIQNLDSPAPPGTPSSDPRRLHHLRKRSSNGGLQLGSSGGGGGWPEPVLRRETMPETGPSSESTSYLRPTRAMVRNRSVERSLELAPASPRGRHPSKNGHAHSPPPPLLLAPPPPPENIARLSTSTERALMRLLASAGTNRFDVKQIALLVLFIVKISVMVRPCWPYMTRLEIGIPLIVVAALDLNSTQRSRRPLVRRHSRHDDEYSTVAAHVFQSWPGKRALLLALHMFVLWMAGRWDVLCASH